MNKKIFSLLTALVMVFQLGTTAFATLDFTDNVDTSARMQIVENGDPVLPMTANYVEVEKNDADPFPLFDYLCTLDMSNVRDRFTEYYTDWATILGYIGTDADRIAQLNTELENMQVTGNFAVEITYPNSLIVPPAFLANGTMAGFDDNAKLIFGNDVRTVVTGATTSTLTIQLDIVGPAGRPGYVLAKDLMDNIDTFLGNFSLKCEGVGTTEYGTFVVSGKMTGFTLAVGPTATLRVDYATEPEYAEATCVVKKKTGNGYLAETVTHIVSFDVEGDTDLVDPIVKPDNSVINDNELVIPYKDGYTFDGWYLDKEMTQKVPADMVVTEDITLYGQWKKSKPAEDLNDADHYAYIVGYPEEDVRPLNNITREEVATIFFRLLKEETRNALMTKTNTFTDVDASRWSNVAISTMENGGYITGYDDGTFAPGAYITRAEFATMASMLDTMSESAQHGFTDISGHWAEKYIADAVAKGWIAGYDDNTFRPDQFITRAEAMTIINRMLNRFVNEQGLHADAKLWPDNDKNAWYYYAVEEATNSHAYERQADGVHETWTEMIPNFDWASIER